MASRFTWIVLLVIAACGREQAARETGLLAGINDYRKGAGLEPLGVSGPLQRAATAHADEMDELGYYGHFSPRPANRTPDQRVYRAGWEQGRPYDELMCRAGSPETALATLKENERLNERLLDARFRFAGIGHAGQGWVVLLGK